MHGYLACEGKTAHSVIDDPTAMPSASRLIASALPEAFSYFALDAEPPIAGARTARAEASQSLGGADSTIAWRDGSVSASIRTPAELCSYA